MFSRACVNLLNAITYTVCTVQSTYGRPILIFLMGDVESREADMKPIYDFI